MSVKSQQPIESNTLQDEEKDDIEVRIVKDTATWVDGKTYQFINIIVRFDYIKREEKKDFAIGTGRFSVAYDYATSSNTIQEVLHPIMMQSDSEGLFLIDDFESFRKNTYFTIVYLIDSKKDSNSVYLYRSQIELGFDEFKSEKFQKKYPEANCSWYKKWKEKNPNFEGERERYVKRKSPN